MAIYKLSLDDEMDKDILDYIDSFPRMRKSEMVRQAIREHMVRVEGGMVATTAVVTTKPPVKTKAEKPVEEPVVEDKPKKNRFANAQDSLGLTAEKPVNMSGIY